MGTEVKKQMTQAEKDAALASGKVVIQSRFPQAITVQTSNKDVIIVEEVTP